MGVQGMTDQQINHAIAEACGWTPLNNSGVSHNHKLRGWPPKPPGAKWNVCGYLPDYCNDLNAMHEAEQSLSDWQWKQYAEILYDSVYYGFKGTVSRRAYSATARQRAESFLKAIGKWKEAAE
jgi:hypothetical protein